MVGCIPAGDRFSALHDKSIINQRCVYLDPQFSGVEKKIIQNSFEEWTVKTGGFFQWKYQDWPSDYWKNSDISTATVSNDCSKHLLVMRGISTDALVINAEVSLGHGIWGYAHRSGQSVEYVLLVADKIEGYNDYRLVALHEIGHILGLNHNDNNSLMNSPKIRFVNGITPYDLDELWKIYGNKE